MKTQRISEKCPVWNGNIGRVSLCFGSPLSVSYLLGGATVTLTRGIRRLAHRLKWLGSFGSHGESENRMVGEIKQPKLYGKKLSSQGGQREGDILWAKQQIDLVRDSERLISINKHDWWATASAVILELPGICYSWKLKNITTFTSFFFHQLSIYQDEAFQHFHHFFLHWGWCAPSSAIGQSAKLRWNDSAFPVGTGKMAQTFWVHRLHLWGFSDVGKTEDLRTWNFPRFCGKKKGRLGFTPTWSERFATEVKGLVTLVFASPEGRHNFTQLEEPPKLKLA